VETSVSSQSVSGLAPEQITTTTTNLREKRYRPPPSLYRFTYSALVERDTETCQICGAGPPLDIDHQDGRKETWVLSHLRLLCRPCNVSLQFNLTTSVKEREKIEAWPSNIAWEGKRHLQLEVDYESSLDQLLDQGPVTVGEAQDRLAYITKSDQQTVARWLKRATTPEGPFTISQRKVSDGRKSRTEQFLSRKRVP